MRSHQMPDYWCISDSPLEELFELFRVKFPTDEFVQDAENVWAWVEGKTRDQKIGFNISRKHHMGDPLPVEPVAFRFTIYGNNADLTLIGSLLARALQTTVYLGEIKYLESEEFSCRQADCFSP